MVLRCLKSTDASPVLGYWLLESHGLCHMLLLSLNSNNACLRQLLKTKMALVSAEGWRERVTVLFRNINYQLV